MRGVLVIIVLIAMLIVGVLVIQDMKTETAKGVDKKKVIEKAQKAADEAEKASQKAARTMEDVMTTIKNESKNAGGKE